MLTGNGGPTTDYLCLPLPIQPVGDFDLDQIALLECVGHGRYGNVWRAVDTTDSLKRLIAVKIYQLNSQCNAKIFLNECQVYNLPFMAEHRNLLDFYGAREKVFEPQMFDSPPGSGLDEFEMGSSGNMTGPRREGWLFLSYNSGGTLQEFLKGNTVTWTQFCSMGSSITSGLAFLHSELKREGK